jgi:hypothetical protein
LEMTDPFQSLSDRVLWILAHHGGKMERCRLRASTGMRYTLLNPILDQLIKEGRINVALGKHGDWISLKE